MKSHDVKFTMKTGDYKGTSYGFTLVTVNGRKDWQVARRLDPAPAMEKEIIEMGIAVREKNIPLTGAVELKIDSKSLDQLEIIAKESSVALVGLDNIKRLVRVDKDGFSLVPVVVETGRQPEYKVKLVVWSLYE